MDPLLAVLRKVRRRMMFQRWLAFNVKALLISLTLCVLLQVVTRLFPGILAPEPLYLAVLILGILGATAWTVYRRPRLLDAALEADNRLGLQERVTSSLALADADGPMIDALHADARRRLAGLDTAHAFPLYPPRAARWLAVPLLAFVLASFMPDIDLFGLHKRQVEATQKDEARRVQAARLEEVAKRLKEEGAVPGPRNLDALSASFADLAGDLESGELTEKQALAKVTDLAQEIQQHRQALQQNAATPKLLEDLSGFGAAESIAKSIQQGNFGEAAQEAEKLQEKLKKGNLTPEEKKKLAESVKKLAEALKSGELGQKGALNKALAEALAKAGESMQDGKMEGLEEALEGLEAAELSLKDLASAMDQLQKLDFAMQNMVDWQQNALGPSQFCRLCGKALKPCKHGEGCKSCGTGYGCCGICGTCAGNGDGPGMGGYGRGRGNTTGPLGDVEDAFDPTMLPGQLSPGKALLDIVQRTAPDAEDAQTTVEYTEGVWVEAQQEAEQALTKEEIPAGSKEFVRQYFGSLEPTGKETETQPAPAAGQ